MIISFLPSICIQRPIILIFIEKTYRYACQFFSHGKSLPTLPPLTLFSFPRKSSFLWRIPGSTRSMYKQSKPQQQIQSASCWVSSTLLPSYITTSTGLSLWLSLMPTDGHGLTMKRGGDQKPMRASCMYVECVVVLRKALWFEKTLHLQLQCEVSPALRMRDMANNTDDATKDPDILQHLSEAHLQNPMAREDPKWRSVGASRTGTSGQADTAKDVGLDRTHPQKASIQHHTPSLDLEPAGEEEERPASQQLEMRHNSSLVFVVRITYMCIDTIYGYVDFFSKPNLTD